MIALSRFENFLRYLFRFSQFEWKCFVRFETWVKLANLSTSSFSLLISVLENWKTKMNDGILTSFQIFPNVWPISRKGSAEKCSLTPHSPFHSRAATLICFQFFLQYNWPPGKMKSICRAYFLADVEVDRKSKLSGKRSKFCERSFNWKINTFYSSGKFCESQKVVYLSHRKFSESFFFVMF